MADTIHTEIELERKASQPEARMLKTYREYTLGKQRGTLTRGQERILRGLLGNRFCDNVCKMVLTQISNRLTLTRFEVGGSEDQSAASLQVENYLRSLWVLNHMSMLSSSVHFAALRDGDHAVALSWAGDRVALSRERWWNGQTGVFVSYNDQGPRWAVKDWYSLDGYRRTIWYPDRIERYLAQEAGWKPFKLPGEDNWPVPWVDQSGDPLGIPIVHFADMAIPNDGDSKQDSAPEYGQSELAGGLLGLQDEVNDVQRDISASARFSGYQMIYGTGVTPKQDDNGREIPLVVEPGAFFQEENPEANFGVLSAGSLAELERTLNIKLGAVSRMSSVPMHLIAGDWPSGEAIIRAERPLTDRAEGLAKIFGPAWSSVAHKATVLANNFSAANLDISLLISAVFAPAERRDPLTRAQIATAESPMVSRRQSLRTLGYPPDEQDRILSEMDQDTIALIDTVIAKLTIPGYSPHQGLRELGYTEEQITAMEEESSSSDQNLGSHLLASFDQGGIPV